MLTAKEYLLQAKNLNDYINSKLKEISQLRSRICSLQGVSYDGINVKGGTGHNFTDAVDSLLTLEQYIDGQIDKLTQLKKEISDKIALLGDNRFRTVLTRYYLCDETFEEVAKNAGYSNSHVRRLHGLALNEFRKKTGMK